MSRSRPTGPVGGALPADFDAFYREHAQPVLLYFARRTFDVDVARDLTAETFAQALCSRARFRGRTGEEAAGWLYGIARHQLSRYLRRGQAEQRAVNRLGLRLPSIAPDEYDRVIELAGLGELRAELAPHLDDLPVDQRAALHLRVVEDLPYRDVAQRLDISEQTARARVSRALRHLARALEHNRRHDGSDDMTERTDLRFLDDLGAELRRAESAMSRRGGRGRRSRRRLRISTAAAVGGVLVATGIASATGIMPAPWTPLFGDPSRHEPQPAVTSETPPAAQLAALGVLRRPQTAADRQSAGRALRYFSTSTEGVRSAYIRSVPTDDGRTVLVVPAQSWSDGYATKRDVVCLFVPEFNGDGGAKNCATTEEITRGRIEAGTAAVYLGDRMITLVPDAVTTVTATFDAGRSATDTAHDNVVVLRASTRTPPIPRRVIWRSGDGTIIHSVARAGARLLPPPTAPTHCDRRVPASQCPGGRIK